MTRTSEAAYTDVIQTFDNELTPQEILSAVYSGDFVSIGGPPNGESYSNGTSDPANAIVATRQPDDIDGGLDQIFPSGQYLGTAIARYAIFTQDFGYSTETEGNTAFHNLFSLSFPSTASTGVEGTDVEGSATFTSSERVYFARTGTDGGTFYSDPDLNEDNLDKLVTYQLTGTGVNAAPDELVYALFFEDEVNDFDFNDLVVEVRLQPIPEPSTAGLLAGLLGGATLLRRRRRA